MTEFLFKLGLSVVLVAVSGGALHLDLDSPN